MSKPGISFGLSLKKSSSTKPTKPPPAAKRKPKFGGDDSSDDDTPKQGLASYGSVEVITELDGFEVGRKPEAPEESRRNGASRARASAPAPPPRLADAKRAEKAQTSSAFGDLSSALSSRKHAEAAEALDPSIYDYDAVYDSLKPAKKASVEDEEVEKRPRYMSSLMAAATVRERDRLIAEEKKLARERTEEGDEFADKEKFVTEAYRKQQEENRRIEEEEKRREEEEKRKNKNKGMAGFYKEMLERGDREHAEVMKAAEEATKAEGKADKAPDVEEAREKTDSELAQEIIDRGGKITINEDGQVVDKRELLHGGLNIGAKKQAEVQKQKTRQAAAAASTAGRDQSRGMFAPGGKQAMRERQTRMLEAQLEESLKRAREEEEEERKKIELESKSRKTETEISSAKERYLARKRAEAEAKKAGIADAP